MKILKKKQEKIYAIWQKTKQYIFSVGGQFKERQTLTNKLDGWKEAYKEQFELSSIYEKFIYQELFHLKNKLPNESKDLFNELFQKLEKERKKHYIDNRNIERRKKLGYVLEHFRK